MLILDAIRKSWPHYQQDPYRTILLDRRPGQAVLRHSDEDAK